MHKSDRKPSMLSKLVKKLLYKWKSPIINYRLSVWDPRNTWWLQTMSMICGEMCMLISESTGAFPWHVVVLSWTPVQTACLQSHQLTGCHVMLVIPSNFKGQSVVVKIVLMGGVRGEQIIGCTGISCIVHCCHLLRSISRITFVVRDVMLGVIISGWSSISPASGITNMEKQVKSSDCSLVEYL